MRVAAWALCLAACGHPASPPAHAPAPVPDQPALAQPADAPSTKVGVALSVTPADAEVFIDGVSYGKASSWADVIELKPGLYTLLVSRTGYVSYRVEFSVGDKIESFAVQLEPTKK
jgi:hypothetical protein